MLPLLSASLQKLEKIKSNVDNGYGASFLFGTFHGQNIDLATEAILHIEEILRQTDLERYDEDFKSHLKTLKIAAGLIKESSPFYFSNSQDVSDALNKIIGVLKTAQLSSQTEIVNAKLGIKVKNIKHRNNQSGRANLRLIFLCYPSEKEILATKIKQNFYEYSKSIELFMAKIDTSSGSKWSPEIKTKLNSATEMLLLASPEIEGKAYANQEIGSFFTTDKLIHIVNLGANFRNLGYANEYHSKINPPVTLTNEDELAKYIAMNFFAIIKSES